jgi:hypothetical protein
MAVEQADVSLGRTTTTGWFAVASRGQRESHTLLGAIFVQNTRATSQVELAVPVIFYPGSFVDCKDLASEGSPGAILPKRANSLEGGMDSL